MRIQAKPIITLEALLAGYKCAGRIAKSDVRTYVPHTYAFSTVFRHFGAETKEREREYITCRTFDLYGFHATN